MHAASEVASGRSKREETMTHKQSILEELGEGHLVVERSIQLGLKANDRAKYYLALIGLAYEQATSPKVSPEDLSMERRLVGIEDAWLDSVVISARMEGDRAVLPRIDEVLERAIDETRTMLRAVEQCADPESAELRRRLDEIEASLRVAAVHAMPAWAIEKITSADRIRGDGLHLFVMDAHKALSRSAQRVAREEIDGVSVIGISDADRPIIAAFAAGLRRTSALRFDHPGLGTTATRIGERLVIQNDIGQTDAHIFIVSIEGGKVECTYTDVHRQRLAFFQSLIDPLGVSWTTQAVQRAQGLPESSQFYLLRGSIPFSNAEGLQKILETIGAKLVFLIDWNRARKRLRIFVKGRDAVEILKWSAREEIGHMGLLKLGGEELIYQSLEVLEPGSIRPGETLIQVLGRRASMEFLKEALDITSKGLSAATSELLIRDRVKAAFLRHYRSRARGPLDTCRELAGLGVEEALTIREMLRELHRGDSEYLERNVLRVKQWEGQGDEILARFRKEARGRGRAARLLVTAMRIEDQQDYLEEAAYLLVMIDPERSPYAVRHGLERLADLCIRSAQEIYRTVAAAEDVHSEPGGLDDFSRRVDHLVSISEMAKDLRREVRGELARWENAPAGALVTILDFSSELLGACESMARAAMALHEAIFEGATSWEG